MNHRALILVDIQNDFCAGGALSVSDGDAVISVANEIIPKFQCVIATKDWHPANHKSFASQNPGINVGDSFELNGLPQTAWPDHCVQGTPGAELVRGLDTNQIDHIIEKGTDQEIDSYSGFFDNGRRQSTGLDQFLQANQIKQLFIMGLATDYGVKSTAIDATHLGFETFVVLDGCRGVNLSPGDAEVAIREMTDRGIELIESEEIMQWTEIRTKK